MLACTSIAPISLIVQPTEFTDYQYLEPVITALPYEDEFPFVLQNNEIIYSMRETLDKPCNYLMQGYVLGMEGQPFTDAVIVMGMLEFDIPEPTIGYVHILEDGDWNVLLPASSVAYLVWLQTSIDGEQISPKIYVPPRGCDNNMATLTFIQVQP